MPLVALPWAWTGLRLARGWLLDAPAAGADDLSPREWVAVLPPVALLVALGVAPIMMALS